MAVACIGAAIQIEVGVLREIDGTRLCYSRRQQQPQLASAARDQRPQFISRRRRAFARVTVVHLTCCKAHFDPRARFGAALTRIIAAAAATGDDCPVL